MKYIDIPDGRVPALGFGTFDIRGEDCVRATATALEFGYRHIDTAQEYGNEAEVGRAIDGSGVERSEIFLTTKIWPNLIGNGDLHAKNWSLLYRDGRTPELSPAYDLLCTTTYVPGDAPAFAIGAARRWESLGLDDFADLADSAQVPRAVFVRAAQETCERFRDCWRDVAQDLPLRDDVRAAIERQIETVPAARGVGRITRVRPRRRPPRTSRTETLSNS